ncbi:MAG TPA: hypothetical protein VJS64_01325 [Pyrinomonadaceae bacterium]|nr:hypothetical protein [Pyrinomonadaceae bacterium]
MPVLSLDDQGHISRAFELAYFIIPDKSIALRVTEDAWCSLELILGKQERSRKTYRQLLGYLKGEERSRPLRTKIRLSHEQTLQWLVYAQSDSWERATEYGDSLYTPRMEDMIVRYIKHLVRITSNRNSFYVALGITRLLHEYGTKEVRLMYDVLTASDSARMKDLKYLRKQRARLMDEVLLRFDGMLQTITTASREKRFESQPASERLIHLARECARRFTPWNTHCELQEGFDPMAVSGLYFAGTNLADEDRIETSRIHTILHPDCFSRFVRGLAQFVGKLPPHSPDKGCKFEAPEDVLAIPQFHNFTDGSPRDDRFDPPKLGPEDYLRLERSRETLNRRRRVHSPDRLCVCVDDVERAWFKPSETSRIQLDINPGESLIEVFGEDAEGELPVAFLIVCCDDIPPGGVFRDSIVLEAGQKVTIQLQPSRDTSGDLEKASVEVSYEETNLVRAVSWHAHRAWRGLTRAIGSNQAADIGRQDYSWLVKAGLVFVLMIAAVTFIWFQVRPPRSTQPSPVNREQTPVAGVEPGPSVPAPAAPSVTPTPAPKQSRELIASVSWNRNPEAAREAIRLEPERGEALRVEVPRSQRRLLIALPQTNTEAQAYSFYRVTLLAADKSIWQQMVRAPAVDSSRNAHVLNLLFSSPPLIDTEHVVLRFDGKTRSGWQLLGQITIQGVER